MLPKLFNSSASKLTVRELLTDIERLHTREVERHMRTAIPSASAMATTSIVVFRIDMRRRIDKMEAQADKLEKHMTEIKSILRAK